MAKKAGKKAASKKVSKKAASKSKPAPALGFKNLAKWQRVPADEVEFDFLEATNDSVAYDDCFGDEPSHLMIHTGSLSVDRLVELDGWKAASDAQQTIYIVDGDLTVDGALIFDQCDIMTTLWVTGTLKVKRLACTSTAMLIVGGALEVAELMITDLEDAGHLIIHGKTSAPTWIDLAHGRGCIELAEPPQTRYLSDHYADPDNAEEKDDDDDAADDDEPATHRPSSFPVAPATPALLPALIDDESVNWRKVLLALRKGGPILA